MSLVTLEVTQFRLLDDYCVWGGDVITKGYLITRFIAFCYSTFKNIIRNMVGFVEILEKI